MNKSKLKKFIVEYNLLAKHFNVKLLYFLYCRCYEAKNIHFPQTPTSKVGGES